MPRVLVDLLQYTGKKGGMEVYIRELYGELGRRESEFDFVGFASRELVEMDHSWFPGELIDSSISGENRIAWALGEMYSVGRAANRVGADLVHGPAMFGPPRSNAPVVVTFHDLLYFSNPELMTTPIYTGPVKWMERLSARNASRIITISRWSEEATLRYLRYPPERIDVIPLAGTPRVRPRTVRARDTDHFLAVGQRRPHKNFDTILAALASIPAVDRPRLTITGSYGDDPLKPRVVELGLEDHVNLLGWIDRDELEELFATVTAMIDASLVTGFGMPAIEAMLDGIPVILADTPVFREVGGNAPRYFDPHDPLELARTMVEIVRDEQLRSSLTAAGRLHASTFSWSRVADQTLDTFRSAIANPR